MRDVSKHTASAARLLILGDSFAEGVGVRYEGTLASRLETELATRGRPTEVLNGAVASYSPFLEYRRLRQFFESGYETDEILLFIDLSDIQDEALNGYDKMTENQPFRGLAFQKLLGWNHAPHQFWEVLTFGSIAEQERYYDERDQWTENDQIWERWGRRGMQLCGINLRKIVQLAGNHAARLRLVIYPWPTQIRSRRPVSRAEDEFLRFGRENGVPVTDTFPLFRELSDWTDAFLRGDTHWNESGHAMVAKLVAQDIIGVR